VERGALIIQMRSWQPWEAAVPELAGYELRYGLRGMRSAPISPVNCPDGWPEIIRRLGQAL
jgi:hypothetical protein